MIARHWAAKFGSPYVWLLRDRTEWRGRGWAATRPDGHELCVVTTVAATLPPEHLKTLLAHEFGHVLFIAGASRIIAPRAETNCGRYGARSSSGI